MPKVLVSLDDRLLEQLDREATARGLSRSALIGELVAKGLAITVDPGARPESRHAIERIRELFTGREPFEDATHAIRAMRDERAERDAGLG